MASGEGVDLAVEWQKKVLAGQFEPVLTALKEDGEFVSTTSVLTVLNSICTLIGKVNKKEEPAITTTSNKDLGDLTNFCVSYIGTKNSTKTNIDLIKRALQSIHFNTYYLYTKGLYKYAGDICSLLPTYLKFCDNTENEEKKLAVHKILLEMGSIAWNCSFKLVDWHGCPNLDLCVLSLNMLNKLDQSSSQTAYDRTLRLLGAFNKNPQCLKKSLKVLTECIWPILEATNGKAELQNLRDRISLLCCVLLSSGTETKVESCTDLFPSKFKSAIECAIIPKELATAFEKSTVQKGNIDNFKNALDENQEIAKVFCDKMRKSQLYPWKSLSSKHVILLQEALFYCLAHIPECDRIDVISLTVVLTENLVPKVKSADPWKDNHLGSLKWTLQSLEFVKNDLCQPEFIKQSTTIFFNVMVYGYNFHHKANCFLEAYTLHSFFIDHAYNLAFYANLDEFRAEKLANCLVQGTKFISALLLVERPGKEKEMAKKAISICLQMISSMEKLKSSMLTADFERHLSKGIAAWCDARVAAAKVLNDSSKGVKDYLQSKGVKLSPDLLETILSYEYEGYSKIKHSDVFIKVTCETLENLENKSTESSAVNKRKLVLLLAKGNSEELSDIEESVKLATELAATLQNEVKKNGSLDSLITLILSLHQEYLGTLKANRVKNKALADVPLTVRAPTKGRDNEDEVNSAEDWEKAVELSQLGQVLSCRLENRNFKSLLLILQYASQIMRLQNLTSDDVHNLEPVLLCLESVGLHFMVMGHDWCAIKCWNTFYLLSLLVECPVRQLRALSWLITKFKFEAGDNFNKWLITKSKNLVQNIKRDKLTHDSEFTLTLFEICLAQCYNNSSMHEEAAEILLRLRPEIDETKHFWSKELLARLFFVASLTMGNLSGPLAQKLADSFTENIAAANFAFQWVYKYVSCSKPAERDLMELRLAELMISSGLWLSSLANMSGYYKISCTTLQILLQKTQKMHFATRVAQILSCLGDLDILVPDTEQVVQRLFWNQKILSLGAAIVGRDASPNATSPSKFSKKEHQLTASCSEKCRTGNSCTLCKNPLFQICKAHYLYLATTNEEAFWILFNELEKTNVDRSKRLSELAWANITEAVDSKLGWMSMLQDPLDLLKCRMLLAIAPREAALGKVSQAMDNVLMAQDLMLRIKSPICKYLKEWASAEEKSIDMQSSGIGAWDELLEEERSFALLPEYSSEGEESRPCSPTPNIKVSSKPPPKPKRVGRRALVDEPAHIDPPRRPQIKVVNLSENENSPDEKTKPPAVTKKRTQVPKTCKKPQMSLKDRFENDSLLPELELPAAPVKSKSQLVQPKVFSRPVTPEVVSKTTTNTKKNELLAKRAMRKCSSSSSDTTQVSKTRTTRAAKTPIVLIKVDSDSSSDSDIVTQMKRKAKVVDSSDSEVEEVPVKTTSTRSRRK